jgi:hypothetical protein
MIANVVLALCASVIVPVVLVDLLKLESAATRNIVATLVFSVCLLLAAMTLAGV